MPLTLKSSTISLLERAYQAQDAKVLAEKVLKLARAGHSDVLRAMTGHPLADDWQDFVYAAVAQHFEAAKGTVYIVANPAQNGFNKVGKTRKSPEDRLKELNNEAVVGRFVLVASWSVYDRHYLESAAHRSLSDVPRHKEFFHCDWRLAVQRVQQTITSDHELLTAAGLRPPAAEFGAVA